MTKRLDDMNEVELRTLMNAVMRAGLAAARLQGVDHPLMAVLIFNDPSLAQYASNCERDCMIQALREAANRLEANQDVPRPPPSTRSWDEPGT